MIKTTLSTNYDDMVMAIKLAIHHIKSICGMALKDTIQIIIPCLVHFSDREREIVMNNNLDAEVLSDFPCVKDLDVYNIMEVSKYLEENYNILALRNRDGMSPYTVVMYYRTIRK